MTSPRCQHRLVGGALRIDQLGTCCGAGSAFFSPPTVGGALGSIGQEIRGVGFGMLGMMRPTCRTRSSLKRWSISAQPQKSKAIAAIFAMFPSHTRSPRANPLRTAKEHQGPDESNLPRIPPVAPTWQSFAAGLDRDRASSRPGLGRHIQYLHTRNPTRTLRGET